MASISTEDLGLYDRLFPVAALCGVGGGVASYAVSPLTGTLCFLAVALGLALDGQVRKRLFARVERQASAGWQRVRGPNGG